MVVEYWKEGCTKSASVSAHKLGVYPNGWRWKLNPDRYVDVFQGRAPKTVLAKFYTGKELLRLKSIYQKFSKRLRILD